MKKQVKFSGFTLIELLVVIVILGILSTISVGTFRSYFAKARDAERVSAVQNMAMMIKVDSGGHGDCTVYNYTEDAECPDASAESLGELFITNDFKAPDVKNGLNYFYMYLPGATEGDNNFFIAVGAEEKEAANGIWVPANNFYIFADGTSLGMNTAPLCTWTDGNLVSCPDDVNGQTWATMPLSGATSGGECGVSNCGGCGSTATCTAAGCSWPGTTTFCESS